MNEQRSHERLPRRLPRRALLRAAAMGAPGLMVAACGKTRKPESVQEQGVGAGVEPAPPRPGESAVAVAEGGVSAPAPPPAASLLTLADSLSALDTADPRRSISLVTERWLGQLVYAKLLRWESVADDQVAPDLAAALPESPEPTTQIFSLRPGVTWDERPPTARRPVVAEDVRLTIVSQQERDDLTFPRGDRLRDLTVEVPDATTIVVRSAAVDARLPGLSAGRWLAVLPRELLAADIDPTDPSLARGCGPFALEAGATDAWQFRANASYYGGRPLLDRLVLRNHDAAGQAEAFAQGAIDMVERAPVDLARSLAGPDDRVTITGFPAVVHLFLRHDRPPWDDPRRRRAVHLALDRGALVDAWFGEGAGVSGFIPPPHRAWALPDADLRTLSGYRNLPGDRGEARALWEVAGGSAAVEPLRLTVRAADEAGFAPGATIAAQLQAALGVAVSVQPLEEAALLDAVIDGSVLWLVDFAPTSPEVLDYVEPLFSSRGALNTFGFVDAEVDAAIAAIVGTWDRSLRGARVTALQQLLLDRLPTLPIGYPALATVARPGIVGRRPDILDNAWQYAAVRRDPAVTP